MSISFANATGNLFTVLGRIGGMIARLNVYQADQKTVMINSPNGLTYQLATMPEVQAIVGDNWIPILSSSGGVIGGVLQGLAAAVTNKIVFNDNPQYNQTLTAGDTLTSILEIIRQMKLQGASVLAMTVTGTPGSFVGTGNGVVNVSTKRPSDGMTCENAFSENLKFVCTADSYSGRATEGNEPLQVTGVGNQGDVFAFDWPAGSNCSISVSAINGTADNSQGNLLTNSGFDAFTDGLPDNWTLNEGAAGVNIFQETTLVYDSPPNTALRITGDAGGTLTEIVQLFGDSSGTSGTLNTLSQYSVNVFSRRDGTVPAAGVLEIALIDSGGTIIQDMAGVDNSFTIDCTALTTSYTAYKGSFRTPAILPDTYYLRIRLSTALTNSRSVYLDKASFGAMSRCYNFGPYVAAHAGSVPFLTGDYATATILNSRGAGGTLNSWQTLAFRLLPELGQNDILLPSAGSPNVLDAWIA